MLGFDNSLELFQAIFEHTFLRDESHCKLGSNLFVQCPQLVGGH